jgi:copper resistance protein B
MKRLILLLALGTAAPAMAQHEGHSMPGTGPMAHKPAPAAKAKPKPRRAVPVRKATPATRAKPQVRKATPARKPAPGRKPAPAPHADPHAGHHMPEVTEADPHAGHQMPDDAPTDPHAGHQMGGPAADPHAGHVMEAGAPPVAPPPAGALSGPAHAADAVYGSEAMAGGRQILREEHGDIRTSKVMIDRLEDRAEKGRDGYAWDGEAWYGGDIDKLWMKSEGEGAFGEKLEHGEVQALWSRAIDPWFDLQLGVRQDFGRGPERTHLAVGVQGLAPYWFEVDAAAFVSTKGDVTARIEVEYDLRLTQKLILQPEAQLEFSLQDVPELRVGSGVSTTELGLRLRYEIKPQFAPYLGVEYQRGLGGTARLRRAAGEDVGGLSLLLGLRAWF